jgi:restriction system protein
MIPDYQSIMLPLLEYVKDGKERTLPEAIEYISTLFKLTEQEKHEMLPSGMQTIIENRVGWARTYLKKAGLVESTKRGFFKISNRGLEILKQNPSKIDNKFLMQFTEFVEFHNVKKGEKQNNYSQKTIVESLDPMETLENAFQRIKGTLADDLLKEVKNATPVFFEKTVLKLLRKMGYGDLVGDSVEHTGKTGDEGVDGKIKEDKLGLDVIYVQAKKWENTVSRPEIQKFVGALKGQNANKGIFITTSDFSGEALEYAKKIDSPKIVLIDGETLAQYMIDHDVGVSKVKNFEIKRKDTDFFVED